jgi:hypothetical protein
VSFDLQHALRVASEFPYGSDEWAIALFHDAFEDGHVTLEEMFDAGLHTGICVTVRALARQEPYADYIQRLATDDTPRGELARRVKLADLHANLERMDESHASLRPRYEKARKVLEGMEVG